MQKLPPELLLAVASLLNHYDVWNLSCVCKRFLSLLYSESFARTLLEVHAPYSTETKAARCSGRYADQWRLLVKMHDSIVTAKPYSVDVVAYANEYIYCNGMLCYTQKAAKKLYIFDIHRSARNEIEIDVETLLDSMLQIPLAQKDKFRPIHYSDNILSCLYIPHAGPRRLFVIDIQRRKCFLPMDLDSSRKLFVRNNQEYLYCGTLSLTDDDGHRRWKIVIFDLKNGSWLPGHLALWSIAGSDVGATVAFEIIDDHFYAVSSEPTVEPSETDYLFRYHGVRYPLGLRRPEDKQLMSESMFRRDHREGPVDDRWSTLSLEKDPKTGVLHVAECRRERSYESGETPRTMYRTAVKICNSVRADDFMVREEGSEQDLVLLPGFQDYEPNLEGNLPTSHRGDDGLTKPLISHTKCFVRSYNSYCEAFIDLINPVVEHDEPPSLQVRFITRLLAPLNKQSDSRDTKDRAQQEENNIFYWPPQTKADEPHDDSSRLADILTPSGHRSQWHISEVADDRSLIYVSGNTKTGNLRPLVFISFDPSIRLPGDFKWLGAPPQNAKGVAMKTHPDAPANQGGLPHPAGVSGDCVDRRPSQAFAPKLTLAGSEAPIWLRSVEAMCPSRLCVPLGTM
ncbi:F-box domain-containing protein [Colletotrichum limetticola]|uniref:F-box domain-containing protein n=1 Tax=Colletotrichum limetticola TaxID=1209924 RepID=A0ABQ9PB66_9PEZI|nr:F-box domain-containing protein [Colletotrichum limetticola]